MCYSFTNVSEGGQKQRVVKDRDHRATQKPATQDRDQPKYSNPPPSLFFLYEVFVGSFLSGWTTQLPLLSFSFSFFFASGFFKTGPPQGNLWHVPIMIHLQYSNLVLFPAQRKGTGKL
jgi:hypothetical protein